MFQVDQYNIVFKRVWHKRMVHPQDRTYVSGDGRYDTVCEIYFRNKKRAGCDIDGVVYDKEPSFTGIAKLHPNDKPNKIVGKKIALRNAIGGPVLEGGMDPTYNCAEFYYKPVRTAIWKAFWVWEAGWPTRHQK